MTPGTSGSTVYVIESVRTEKQTPEACRCLSAVLCLLCFLLLRLLFPSVASSKHHTIEENHTQFQYKSWNQYPHYMLSLSPPPLWHPATVATHVFSQEPQLTHRLPGSFWYETRADALNTLSRVATPKQLGRKSNRLTNDWWFQSTPSNDKVKTPQHPIGIRAIQLPNSCHSM